MKNYLLVFLTVFALQINAQQEWLYPDFLSASLSGLSMAFDIQNTEDGGYVLFGETDFPTGAIRHNSRLLHTTQEGEVLLDTTYFAGDITSELAEGVYPTSDGGFLLLVRSELGSQLRKVNNLGEILWVHNSLSFIRYLDLRVDSEGDIYLVGEFLVTSPESYFPYLIKLEGEMGAIIWEKSIEVETLFASFTCLELFPSGGGVAGGNDGSAGFLMRFDAEGNTVWTRYIYNSTGDIIRDIDLYEDESVLFCGAGTGIAGTIPQVGKVDENGEIEWMNLVASTVGTATGIVHLSDNSIRVTGSSYTNPYFQYDTGFLSELSSSGALISEEIWSADKNGSAIVKSGNCFAIAGTKEGAFYLRKECLEIDAVDNILDKSSENIIISPNPNLGVFTVDFLNENTEEKTIKIFDYQGKLIRTKIENGTSFEMDLSTYFNGIYFLVIIENGRVVSRKKVVLLQ